MSKKISFTLSSSSINNAIREIRKYQSDITYKCQTLSRRLAEEGVYIARVKIAEYDAIYTSELLQSINHEYGGAVKDGAKWIIYTDCPYAKFIEFGFGIRGEGEPHPDTSLLNWKYVTNEEHRNGWWYFNDRDGKWHFSQGMPSRPFMYETGQDLRLIVQKVAKEVFNS